MHEAPRPDSLRYHRASRELELGYADGQQYRLSAEYLRVHSPSAEVRGHGKPVLQHGKRDVTITAMKPAGNYALQIVFDDGHDSGLFSWRYLHDLCINQTRYWDNYLEQLHRAGLSREAGAQVIRIGL